MTGRKIKKGHKLGDAYQDANLPLARAALSGWYSPSNAAQ